MMGKFRICSFYLLFFAYRTLPLLSMMKDQFANYVVQKMLDVVDDQNREMLLSNIRPHFAILKKFTYGKHIITKVEQLSLLSSSSASLRTNNSSSTYTAFYNSNNVASFH